MALPSAYNLEANGKSKRGHPPISKALAKTCKGRIGDWPKFLPYALWVNCTTHSFVIGYMPFELMYGQKQIMPIEETIISWMNLPWEIDLTREELLALRIRQLLRQQEDIEQAKLELKEA